VVLLVLRQREDTGVVTSGLKVLDPEGHDLLRGKVVVITAAGGSGIGFATARRCLLEGAQVVVSDRSERRLAAAADLLRSNGVGEVTTVACDVTYPDQFERLLEEAERLVGPVDVLINNAGLGGEATVTDMSDEQWNKVLAVSLNGTFYGTRAALRRMRVRQSGTIINVSSVTGWRAEIGQAHYAAAKAGVMALTRCAAVEAAQFNVRVNAVAPTLATHADLLKVVDEDVLEYWAGVQPQGRTAETSEMASVIAFLASDYSSYMVGEVVSVGGLRA
jgi:3-oxoacyl-[acyl-carrier protein] reductase